jgi:hypothetical protein
MLRTVWLIQTEELHGMPIAELSLIQPHDCLHTTESILDCRPIRLFVRGCRILVSVSTIRGRWCRSATPLLLSRTV